MRRYSTLLFAVFLSASAFSQSVVQTWVRQYTAPGATYYNGPLMAKDASGDVYVATSTNMYTSQADFLLLKYNASGVLQWTVTYNSPGNNDDELEAITVDGSGNIIVAGYSRVFDANSSHSVLSTVKYSSAGSLLWAVQTRTGQIDNEARAITTDATGNIYIAGTTIDTTAFAYDYLVLKLNAAGVQQWVATYNGSANQIDWANAIAVDATGNVYVTGQSMGEVVRRNGLFGIIQIIQTGYDYETIKYGPTGQALWSQRYYSAVANYADIPTGLVLDGADNVYVTGSANNVGTTVSYNSSGTLLWTAQGTISQNNTAIALDPSGNVITAGLTTAGNTLTYLVAKYTSGGALTWAQSYYAGPYVFTEVGPSVSMAIDKQSNIYIAGETITSGGAATSSFNYATVEFASSGTQAWAVIYNGPSNVGDIPSALVLYQANVIGGIINYPSLYVTGVADITGTTGPGHLTTIRYNQQQVNHAPALTSAQPDLLNAEGLNASLTTSLCNYPNPVRGTTTIAYSLPNDSHVTLQVYDQSGRTVATLLNEDQLAGPHSVPFRAGRLSAGVYVYRIFATSPQGNLGATKQMVVE
jgi:hypothetical protein